MAGFTDAVAGFVSVGKDTTRLAVDGSLTRDKFEVAEESRVDI